MKSFSSSMGLFEIEKSCSDHIREGLSVKSEIGRPAERSREDFSNAETTNSSENTPGKGFQSGGHSSPYPYPIKLKFKTDKLGPGVRPRDRAPLATPPDTESFGTPNAGSFDSHLQEIGQKKKGAACN